ncbi:hypothetical protein BGP77_01945 [Saccharospirillum sp. MSK14-1]|uniref:YbcC family protein n=1 Tax=Saccharospirillum sp. MSK14-1 TaxID=1897632 RepID=UPI000D35E3F9|nr:DUF2309 domain-containing protein [Saccharospirillum sp. MSK14-1]PTY36103.1 hypothetical protein BGP77_01945 [Saccharospirillum sp. MSK14-1]
MTASVQTPDVNERASVQRAINEAIECIAPSWPLDRLIAVNPYWGRVSQPFETAAEDLARLAGSRLTGSLDDYRRAWHNGDIVAADVQQALAEQSGEWTLTSAVAALENGDAVLQPVALLSDQFDRRRDLRRQPAWCDTITHQISQFCAAYFDRDQAQWHPSREQTLYLSWRQVISQDHSIALLMRHRFDPAKASALADDAEQQIADSLQQLAVPPEQWSEFLQAVLMRISGWAAWCAYLQWQARQSGQDDHSLVELLAIRLSWETLLDDGNRDTGSPWSDWQQHWQRDDLPEQQRSLALLHLWQRAQEVHYQRELAGKLLAKPDATSVDTPDVQAVFCIDVRSEVFRRHFEAQSEAIQTIGFAGFFGLPISYTPIGTKAERPQLPGLLAPSIALTDSSGDPTLDAQLSTTRVHRLDRQAGWRAFHSAPLSNFTLVEATGLNYLIKLIRRSFTLGKVPPSDDQLALGSSATALRPAFAEQAAGGLDGQVELARQVLTALGMTQGFGRLVLLVGHSSQTRNNPHKAGLDCGACCGQGGDVNARALAGLLNDIAIRDGLRAAGIDIPERTQFVAALHNTTTDEVTLLDTYFLPDDCRADLQNLRAQLNQASTAARRERAPNLGLATLAEQPHTLLQALQRRAVDWSHTRPEWGLANNAALLVAPRRRSRGVDLQGRCFLHDYDHRLDADGARLASIMTAPMIVSHWINMQYFASTVDNARYGSGNKTLHNVVGGRIGVFEGNGGDLRIGLPWQSVHDGKNWRHTPLRLTVVIDAPRETIEQVMAEHPLVRQLVEHRWLHLMRLELNRVEHYRDGHWQGWLEV